MNSTANNTTSGDDSPDPFYVWLTTIFAYGTWAVGLYMALTILLVWRLGLYRTYPGFMIRWVLYLECIANLIVGPAKWWPESHFHGVLVLAPTAGSCYFTIIYDTFIGIGVIYCSTIAAVAVYQLSKSSKVAVTAENRRRGQIVTGFFWVTAGGLAGLNISQGYVVKAWCVSTSKVIIGFKVAVAFALIVVQIFCLAFFAVGLIGQQKTMIKLTSQSGKSSGGASMWRVLAAVPAAQRQLLLRFLVVLFSQFITWVPLIWSEFTLIFWVPPSLPLLKLLCVGFFLGGFLDASAALYNRKVLNYLCGGNVYKVFPSSLSRTTMRGSAVPTTQRASSQQQESRV